MTVRRQLTLLAILIFSSLIIIGAIVITSLQHYQLEHADTILMSDIETSLLQRRLATDEYLLTKSEADKQNWIYQQAKLDHLLSTDVVFDAADQKQLQKQIQNDFQQSKQLFAQLTALLESGKVNTLEEDRIKGQMNIFTNETAQHVSSLSKSLQAEEQSAFLMIVGVTSGGLVYFLFLLILALRIIRGNLTTIAKKESELENILNNLPVGVVVVSYPEGKPFLVNKAGVSMLGKGVDAKVTKENAGQLYSFVTATGEPYPENELPLTMVLNTGKPVYKKEIFLKKPDGTKTTLETSAIPLLDNTGKIMEAFAVFTDVTKERDVDRMKNEFISLASHQLRTPLSATKWFLEMLMKGDAGKLTPKQMEFAKNINGSNERMIELVGALLNVSRIESGRLIVEPIPTEIQSIISDIVTETKKMFAEKKQKLTVNIEKDLPKIPIDRKLIRQVYLNLLTNANKYTPDHGEIRITVVKQDGKILSEISDNGYGIPKEDKEKVFQKFYRGANILSAVPTGTGLGLYLVKTIIESSDGIIWFESEEGKGSTFYFTLPLTGMEKKKGEVSLE